MIAIKKGTTAWRNVSALTSDEVEFVGVFLYEADGLTPAMVWDEALQNVRAKNAAELAAYQTEVATVSADRADMKALATQAIADIDAYLVIADGATNVQVRAEVKAIDQRQKRIIKALRRLL